MRRRLVAAAFLFGLAAAPAAAQDIAVALTDELVEVDAEFAGARVVLFGVLTGEDAPVGADAPAPDIVAVLRGPAETFSMRPIERKRMIWAAGPAIHIDAPGLLLTSATRAIDDIAPRALRRTLLIGADAEDIAAGIRPMSEDAAAYVRDKGALSVGDSFLAAARISGRIRDTPSGVAFKKGGLFTINLELPPTTPVGAYAVEVFVFRDGALVSRDSALLAVNKVGVERQIYELAHKRPIAYGIACVVISLAAGWLAAAAFRR